MNPLRSRHHGLALCLVAASTTLARADAVFGPREFTRDSGPPQEFIESFEIRGQASSFKRIVKNGLPDGTRRVSSAWVSLNGENLLGPNDFNQQVSELRRAAVLLPTNELRIRIAGAPGGLLAIRVSAVANPGGGFLISPAGARLTIPPGSLADEVAIGIRDTSLADTGISLPSGYAFLGAVSVELDGRQLGAQADLAVPVSAPPAGRAVAARVLQIGALKRLVLVDTASVAEDGLLHTNSPPFPGLRVGGTYLFTEMPPGLGILGIEARSSTGQPLMGALIDVLVDSVDVATTTTTATRSLESVATFVGQTDGAGFASVPGLAPRSAVTLVAVTPPGAGSVQAALVQTTVPDLPDIVTDGFVGAWLQNLVLHSLNIDPDDIPNAPPQCPCRTLRVNPHHIPASGTPFTPGDTQDLQVFCSPQEPNVTQSSANPLGTLLTTGLSAHFTGYHSTDASVASVSSSGRVTAAAPGSADIYLWTHFISLFKATIGQVTVVSPFQCVAVGGVHPVIVSARVQVATVGNGSGFVQSTPLGISCPSTCLAVFAPGQFIELTASPDPDSRFVQWGGNCAGAGAAPTATMTTDVNRACIAEFRLRPRLTVGRTGNGTGTVTSHPVGVDCGSTCTSRFDEGAVVTLTAAPDLGSRFVGWSGACPGTATTTTVTMIADGACAATFDACGTGTVTLTSSHSQGVASVPVPVCGDNIRVRVTVPGNCTCPAHPTTGNCGPGDRSVDIRICSPNQGCTGTTIPAGYGHGLNICHRDDEILGPFEFTNPRVEGTTLSVNAATVSTSVVEVQFQ